MNRSPCTLIWLTHKNKKILPKKRKFYLTNLIYLPEKISFSGSKKNVLSFLETISYISLKTDFSTWKWFLIIAWKTLFQTKKFLNLP